MSHPLAPLPLRKIVVGVDESACAREALRWARGLGALTHTPVDVVHVYPRDLGWLDPDRDADELAEARATATADGQQVLDAILADELDDRGEVETTILLGDAATCLTGHTGPEDLLVVGTHGHGGLSGLLLGSVTRHCVEHATCPVVVIPPGQS